MHSERAALWLGWQVRTMRFLQRLVNLQLVRPGEGLFRHGAGLSVTLNELVRAHPVKKVLAAVPGSEDYVWVAIIDGAQHLIGNKAGHAVHQTGALAKPLFKC